MKLRLPIPAIWTHNSVRWRRFFLRSADANGEATLTSDKIFILPTAYGLLFAVMLVVMLLGSINYNNNLGFMLTFLLTSLGLISILHTYRNLAKITLRSGKFPPVFAGEQAAFTLQLHNPGNFARHAFLLRVGNLSTRVRDVSANADHQANVAMVTRQRGRYPLGPLCIESNFPLGLFRTWAYVEFAASCLVYPKPISQPLPVDAIGDDEGESVGTERGGDDYAGVRNYVPGDSARQINWKALAKGHGLQTKQFTRNQSQTLWLNWDRLPSLDTEMRLSILCHWVLEAHANARSYGLRLPGVELLPSDGEAHKHSCLEALALFGQAAHVRP